MGKLKSIFRDPVGALAVALLALAATLAVLPVLYMLAGTFWRNGAPSLAHLEAAFSDPGRAAALLGRGLAVAAGAVAVSLLLGAPLGFLVFRTDVPLRRMLVLAAILAACVPLYVTARGWYELLLEVTPWEMGGEGRATLWFEGTAGAAILTGIAFAPLVLLITGACFAAADADVEDAARLEASNWDVLRYVTVPWGAWGIAAAAMVVFVLAFTLRIVTDVLSVRVFAEEVLTQYRSSGDPWRAAAVAWPVALVLTGTLLLTAALLRRHGGATAWGASRAPATYRLGRLAPGFGALGAVAAGIFFLVPLGALVRGLGRAGNLVGAYRACAGELWSTLALTACAATACVLLALPLAWVVARRRWGRFAVGTLLVLLVATPAPIAGIGLIGLLNRPGLPGVLYGSPVVLIWAYVTRTLPFAVLALLPWVLRIPTELEEAAALDGADALDRMGSVVAPLSWQGLLVAWYLVFVLAVAENGASVLVEPPGWTVLTVRYHTLVHGGLDGHAAGVCLILLGLVILPGAALAGLLWRLLRTRLAGGASAP